MIKRKFSIHSISMCLMELSRYVESKNALNLEGGRICICFPERGAKPRAEGNRCGARRGSGNGRQVCSRPFPVRDRR